MQGVNPVGWFEIYVQDIAAAQKFYETVLGISMSELPNPTDDPLKMVMFSNDENTMTQTGSSGAIVQMEGFPSGGNSTIVYFTPKIVRSKKAVLLERAVGSSRQSSRSGRMALSPFAPIRKGICSVCTR